MTTIIKNLQKSSTNYTKLSDEDKKVFLSTKYIQEGLSWGAIAKICNVYPNTIRRDGQKFGIKSRNKSEAQSLALSEGRHAHPTQGKTRPDDVKIKISEGMATVWTNLNDDERNERSQQAKDQWANMTTEERKRLKDAAAKGIYKASKEGSQLEKFLYKELVKNGHVVKFHESRLILNERLHLDMFLPKITTVIEIDGPSHFYPIWGEQALIRSQNADAQKSGLILSANMVLIRIKNTKILSQKYKRDILAALLPILESIQIKYPDKVDRFVTIGE